MEGENATIGAAGQEHRLCWRWPGSSRVPMNEASEAAVLSTVKPCSTAPTAPSQSSS